VLVENGHPMWLCLLKKCTTPVDGRLFALEIACTPWTGNIWHFMTGIPNDNILVVTEEVRVQEMFDTLHGFVSVWLLLNENCMCIQSPLFSAKMNFERFEEPICVLWRNARNIPLFYVSSASIHETHGKVLYAYINAQKRHPFIKDLESFK
jgi:hypothetical protein